MATQVPLVIIGGQVQRLPLGDSIDAGSTPGTRATSPIVASFSGPVVPALGSGRYYHPNLTTLIQAYMSLGTASTAGEVEVDVELNGSILCSLSLSAGEHKSVPLTLNQPLSTSDYLTVSVPSAGTLASDLTVYLLVEASPGFVVPPDSTIHRGTATINFGEFPGLESAIVSVEGQAGIKATSSVRAFILAGSTTADHDAIDHMYFPLFATIMTSVAVGDVGFNIYATSEHSLEGTFLINWEWQ